MKKSEAIAQALHKLSEFSHELEEVLGEEFIQTIQTELNALDVRIHLTRIAEPNVFETRVSSRTPTRTQIKSFVLTIRKFENAIDPGSLRTIDALYRSGLLPRELCESWASSYANWIAYLDRDPQPLLEYFYHPNSDPPNPETQILCRYNRRYFLNAFLWGLHAHSEEPYRTDVRERWPLVPGFYSLAYFTFLSILIEYVGFLQHVAMHNKVAEAHLRRQH